MTGWMVAGLVAGALSVGIVTGIMLAAVILEDFHGLRLRKAVECAWKMGWLRGRRIGEIERVADWDSAKPMVFRQLRDERIIQ